MFIVYFPCIEFKRGKIRKEIWLDCEVVNSSGTLRLKDFFDNSFKPKEDMVKSHLETQAWEEISEKNITLNAMSDQLCRNLTSSGNLSWN